MSLFRNAGKKLEETKQAILGDEPADSVCRSCEETLSAAHDYCPHCGERVIESVE